MAIRSILAAISAVLSLYENVTKSEEYHTQDKLAEETSYIQKQQQTKQRLHSGITILLIRKNALFYLTN